MIDEKELERKIKERCNPYGEPDLNYNTSIKILNIINQIMSLSGQWIWDEIEYGYKCSNCGSFWNYDGSYEVFDHGAASYCPNCGIKMEYKK